MSMRKERYSVNVQNWSEANNIYEGVQNRNGTRMIAMECEMLI